MCRTLSEFRPSSTFLTIFFDLVCGRFGVRAQDLPHPEVDWTAFHDRISELNDKEPMIWSPVTKVPAKWINMKQLTATFAPAKTKGKDSSKGVDLATSKGVDLGDSCCIIA